MKKYLWIIAAAAVLVLALLAGILLTNQTDAPASSASRNGEAEIMPDDPDASLPDFTEDLSSVPVSGSGAASSGEAASSGGAASEPDPGAGEAPDSPILSEEELHEYELPHISLR